MLTVILPGYSNDNNKWAEEIKSSLTTHGDIWICEWDHWKTGKQLDITVEEDRILSKIGNERVNIIAKSIGTRVLMQILPKLQGQVNKVILCGIPIDPLTYIKGIKSINSTDMLIIQNSHDPYMPYSLIKLYIKLVDKDIKVIEKDSHTHEYPYFEDFQKFLF